MSKTTLGAARRCNRPPSPRAPGTRLRRGSLPSCRLTLKAKKPVSREKYPDFLRTWGDHIKTRRLDLKLTKRQLSLKFHVDDTTIYLWEKNRVRPSLAQIPKIIEFLGRDPFEKETENLGERIREYRRIHGLTQKKLAEQLGVDQTTLAGWERGEHKPTKKLLDNLKSFFLSFRWV
jgi:transcriptional regulator with XRE-family HTH domain